MSQITININGRAYTIGCEDGQEGHLHELAAYLDERVGELAKMVGQVGDARLLAITGLVLSDELLEAQKEIERLRAGAEGAQAGMSAESTGMISEETAEERLAARVEEIAARIEAIAARFEEA